jgi:hypothetical protein
LRWKNARGLSRHQDAINFATVRSDNQERPTMFKKTGITLSVMIVFGAATSAFAKNQGTMYTDPDSTPMGPYFYLDAYGAPPAKLHQVHEPRRTLHKALTSRQN